MRRLVFALLLACGYEAVHATTTQEKLHVVLVRTAVADTSASDEVLRGATDELARQGALGSGDGYPRMEIEVLRIDETSAGIVANGTVPVARGTDTGVLARAWIVRTAGGNRERDTGDVLTSSLATSPSDGTTDTFAHIDTIRATARRLGRKLAEAVLVR